MKVLHLVSEKTWRGGEQQVAYLIEELTKQGIENTALIKSGSAFEKHCQEHQIKYATAGFKNSVDYSTSLQVRKLVKELKPDIVHLHSSKAHGIMAIATILGVKVPTILSRRVDFPIKSSGFSGWKYNIGTIKKIICVSDTIREIVRKSIKGPERAITIYSGVDIAKFSNAKDRAFLRTKYNLPTDCVLIGNTSALADHKDYHTFVRTAERCLKTHSSNTYFFIIGEGSMKDEIAGWIQSKGIGDKVILTGFLNDIPSILQELDIFLMTSKTEGLGTSVLDAFASKLPVVSTDGGGLKETVIHGKTGLSAHVGDDLQLSKHVNSLIENEMQRSALSESAYQFVHDFSKEETARKTLAAYQSVLV